MFTAIFGRVHWPCTLPFSAIYIARTRPCNGLCTRPLHGRPTCHVHDGPCTRPCTRPVPCTRRFTEPCTSRVHGPCIRLCTRPCIWRVHGLVTAVYMYACVHGCVHWRNSDEITVVGELGKIRGFHFRPISVYISETTHGIGTYLPWNNRGSC